VTKEKQESLKPGLVGSFFPTEGGKGGSGGGAPLALILLLRNSCGRPCSRLAFPNLRAPLISSELLK
jgi:hypothetical protein